MEKNPLVFPNGADIEYTSQPLPYPYSFPHPETGSKMYEGSFRTFQSNPASHNIMNEALEQRRRNEPYLWMDNNVSRYAACSNLIANDASNLYKSDDTHYEEWQYITLYRKFKRILTERGSCSNEMISYLIYNLINIIRNDTALRNLLILSSEEFLESMLTKFVELILNDKAYNYVFSKPNEEENKIKAIRKHLQRATKAASMSHSTPMHWGLNYEDQTFSFPNPVPTSKLNPDSFYYGRQLRSNPMLEGDGCIPMPRVMYPQQEFHFNPPQPMRDLGPSPKTGPVKRKEPSKRYGPRGPYKRTLVRMRMREISKKRAVIRRMKSQSTNSEPETTKDDFKDKVNDEKKNDIELCTTTPESELSDYNKDNDYRELSLNENEHFTSRNSINSSEFANSPDFVSNNDNTVNVNNLEKNPDNKNFRDLSFDDFKDLSFDNFKDPPVNKDLTHKVENPSYRSNLDTYSNEYNLRDLTPFGDSYENSYANPGYLYQDHMNAGTIKPYINNFYRSLNTQYNQPNHYSQSSQYNQPNRYSESNCYYDGYFQNQFQPLNSEIGDIPGQNNPILTSGNFQYVRPNQSSQYSIGYHYPANQPKSIPNPNNPISNSIKNNIPNTIRNPMHNTMSNVAGGVHFSSPNVMGMNSGMGMGRDPTGYGMYPRDDYLSPELNTLETEAPILKTKRVTNPKHSKPLPDGLNDPRRRSSRLNPENNLNNLNNIKSSENNRNINNLNNGNTINPNNNNNLNNINNNLNTNGNNLNDTIWDMVQKHQKSGSNVNVNQTKTVNVVPKEIEFEDEDMNLLIREPVRITEDMPRNHTQPFVNAYKNPKTVKWSYTDTKRFYNAIETFGTDLMLVRAFLPEYTDRQIYDKFKLEERKNPQLMQNSLQTHKSISLKQYEQKYGKIDTETHYNPSKDPFILEQPTDNKKSLQLNLSNASVMNQIQQTPNDKIINLFM
ncbi:uncharacterized protein TA04620 [Theileria annulata]|uniref:Transcription factor TFIIIB component B'' Myb domain-containing protein n=1 Tax=Theileria annulata TaxID=5874 RepID=Q4UBZ0_THEAN|nr:uncharacterized protein TA04620 [Theileria annulata]CAI75661.1 hypothetical protein, conserved [Theileria annulata]|eukprot:XP_955137.1 hypothetical protein, conserved [Theileria annulata]